MKEEKNLFDGVITSKIYIYKDSDDKQIIELKESETIDIEPYDNDSFHRFASIGVDGEGLFFLYKKKKYYFGNVYDYIDRNKGLK